MNYRLLSSKHLVLFIVATLSIFTTVEAAFDNVWNFNGDLSADSGAGTMNFVGGADGVSLFTNTTNMGITSLYGDNGTAGILAFSAYTPSQEIGVTYGTTATITDYTMSWDILFPAESDGVWRTFYQTGVNTGANADDAELYILDAPSGGIGIMGQYDGSIVPDTWNRVTIAKDASAKVLRKYINGVRVGTYYTGDSDRWDLKNDYYSILSDNWGSTAFGYIASHRVTDQVLSDEEIYQLGGAHASGCTVAGQLSQLPPAPPAIDTVWNFDGNLNAESGSAVMTYVSDTANFTSFGTTADFGLPSLAGDNGTAQVMSFPKTTSTQGYKIDCGTDILMSEYTMVWDVLFPTSTSTSWRCFYQTSPDNSNDGELYVNETGSIGISEDYAGTILADTWHRVAITLDEDGLMTKYIDGVEVGKQYNRLPRHGIQDLFYILCDDDGDTDAGYISSYRFLNSVLTSEEIAELGGVNAAGAATGVSPNIPGDANKDGKVDGSDVTILAGNWQVGVGGVGGATWGMGDFNGDGAVDGSDVTILAGNWQYGVNSAATAVPEPSTVLLVISALIGFSSACRRKKSKMK